MSLQVSSEQSILEKWVLQRWFFLEERSYPGSGECSLVAFCLQHLLFIRTGTSFSSMGWSDMGLLSKKTRTHFAAASNCTAGEWGRTHQHDSRPADGSEKNMSTEEEAFICVKAVWRQKILLFTQGFRISSIIYIPQHNLIDSSSEKAIFVAHSRICATFLSFICMFPCLSSWRHLMLNINESWISKFYLLLYQFICYHIKCELCESLTLVSVISSYVIQL